MSIGHRNLKKMLFESGITHLIILGEHRPIERIEDTKEMLIQAQEAFDKGLYTDDKELASKRKEKERKRQERKRGRKSMRGIATPKQQRILKQNRGRR